MVKKKVDEGFHRSAKDLLDSIGRAKKELTLLRNDELRKLSQSEKEQIKLVKMDIRKQKEKVISRYEKKKEELGKALLDVKNRKLSEHLLIEKDSLSKTNKKIDQLKKLQQNFK